LKTAVGFILVVFKPAFLGTLTACFGLLTSTAISEPRDPLGSVGPMFLPVPAPSLETKRQTYTVGSQKYSVPRNYILSLSKNDDGTAGLISMRAILPDLTGLTSETLPCVQFGNPCSKDMIIVGLGRGQFPSGSKRLENIQSFNDLSSAAGPCGLEYYESRGVPQQRHQDFFKRLSDDVAIIDCPKEGSDYAPRCVYRQNISDGNNFYLNFDRNKLCSWEEIKTKVTALLDSFRKGAD
jgi:hypothetical protein